MECDQIISIFTVDDSEIVCKNLGLLLKENKNILWTGHAFSLNEAYIEIEEKNPDVVILDIQLKRENSFGLLKHLSKNYPDIVVIMLSNLSSVPYRSKSIEFGARYFLDKSSEIDKLPLIIDELLCSR